MTVAVLFSNYCYHRYDDYLLSRGNTIIFNPVPKYPFFATVLLTVTKSLKSQFITMRSFFVCSQLKRLIAFLEPTATDRVFYSIQNRFLRAIHNLVRKPSGFHLSRLLITPHSLRYGEATRNFQFRNLTMFDFHLRFR